jgi:UrcA family protein
LRQLARTASPWPSETTSNHRNTTEETTMNMMNTTARSPFDFRSLLFSGIALAGLTLGTTQVRAADEFAGSPVRKVAVQFGDLNLANAAGVEQLYHRITAAARQVCDNKDSKSLLAQIQARHCVRASIERAVTVVDSPALTALHGVKTGSVNRYAELVKR